MKPDTHKQKKSAQYKKKHGIHDRGTHAKGKSMLVQRFLYFYQFTQTGVAYF